MGEYWSWSDITLNHPDVGCEFSNGRHYVDCPFKECWEVIGRPKFKRDNLKQKVKQLEV